MFRCTVASAIHGFPIRNAFHERDTYSDYTYFRGNFLRNLTRGTHTLQYYIYVYCFHIV